MGSAQTPPTTTPPGRTAHTGLARAMLAEFVGTFMLLLMGLGTCAPDVVGPRGSGRQTVPDRLGELTDRRVRLGRRRAAGSLRRRGAEAEDGGTERAA